MKRLISLFSIAPTLLLLSGCYTQFLRTDSTHAPQTKMVVNSEGDSVKVVRQVDTITTTDREICVWQRDIAGYPRLRCFRSNYTQNWHFYQNLPWWYRNNPQWGDYDRCPPFYYFDYRSGTCRYIGSTRPPVRRDGAGGSSPEEKQPSELPPPRSRTPGLEGAELPASDNSSTTRSSSASTTSEEESVQTYPNVPKRRSDSASSSSSESAPVDTTLSPEQIMGRNPRSF
ncbi:hypothetical protein QA601_12325 [Chitinispirillales bacterium ANBcel5]|uniref:hypothetical protein n=1 Tax=Cellulosispirillum alkaliphilum TaxID=3039283 RepID=UPI002A562D41|nr:hypothetical protein [Chitinispirillales bacterium ANBcel5]